MLPHNNDQDLMRRTAKGDKTAYSAFLIRHLDAVVNFAMRYVGQRTDAEDIAQEAFMRVWQKAKHWQQKPGVSPRSWLYRITYNLCIDALRRQRPNVSLDALTLSADPYSNPERRTLCDAQMAQLEMALSHLNIRQYTALSLCVFSGLNNKEAAAAMEITIEALESLLARARRALRKYLQPLSEGIV